MPTFRQLLEQARAVVTEVSPESVAARLRSDDAPVLLDVREPDETAEGHLPGALLVPRGNLELRVERMVDRDREVVIYCGSGVRSVLAARTLLDLGYARVSSLAGGYGRWSDLGLPRVRPTQLRADQKARYRRHLSLPEVGEEGQARLASARVLLLGAGGLGSPAALYLAAAGVGTLGIVDSDVVEVSNLQRQVLHRNADAGRPKTESARDALTALNPEVKVVTFAERLTAANVLSVVRGFEIVVDGGDNFPTRYLLNDACVLEGIPLVHGSVYRFEGQATTLLPGVGPCYRCLYPAPPPPELAPSCAEAGVLGVLPGLIGLVQANEVLKLLLGIGTPLVGRLLTFDALGTRFSELALRRDPACPTCRPGATITLSDEPARCEVPDARA
ncbi:MAG TPA: molybdopterin-synthase adenylyltransferase MoeB [Myxococcaceae bacterium]|nr:molybdopterin-synthase adenylyltransferase MoeB [Myxococcaceae bacterium]